MTALDFIAQEEGYRDKPYRDGAGYWTIGWGRLLTMDRDADPSQWEPINRADEMRDYFAPWVERRRQRVVDMFRPAVTYDVGKVAALTSFAYNLGVHALATSQLREIVNESARDRMWPVRVALEWVDWSNRTVGGVKSASAGLVDRRRREVALFFGV